MADDNNNQSGDKSDRQGRQKFTHQFSRLSVSSTTSLPERRDLNENSRLSRTSIYEGEFGPSSPRGEGAHMSEVRVSDSAASTQSDDAKSSTSSSASTATVLRGREQALEALQSPQPQPHPSTTPLPTLPEYPSGKTAGSQGLAPPQPDARGGGTFYSNPSSASGSRPGSSAAGSGVGSDSGAEEKKKKEKEQEGKSGSSSQH
ncbi:hypothetical protein F4780DRAFT_675827 [Xylariomycetidae sp. FL0641]|nr:hypothetical protein F4780DRAFT_675827 [Xylariomycetidae sp. FL0641]